MTDSGEPFNVNRSGGPLAQDQRESTFSLPSWKTGYPDAEKRKETYLEWLLTPEAERSPTTKRKLAEALGVSTQTLRNYAQDPLFQKALIQRGRTLYRVERALPVLDSLYRQAIDSDNPRSVAAAKVILEYISKVVDPDHESDIHTMSDGALAKYYDALQARIKEN
jgi:hypothetical protein